MGTTKAYTLESWISKFRAETLTVSNFTFSAIMSDGNASTIFMDESIISKYHHELDKHLVSIRLTDRERDFYKYQPRLLAYDIYGAPEMWFLILYANEMISALDMDVPVIKIYKATVKTMLYNILSLEEAYKDENAQFISDVIINKIPTNADILTS